MKRIAFKMKLKPGFTEEYKRRHDALWPEVKELLINSGVSNYSIFLDEETNTLFAYQEMEGKEFSSQQLGHQETIKKWWAYMSDIMETNQDNSPVTAPLINMFYMK